MQPACALPPWVEWSDHTKMQIIASYMWWHLFNDNGKPSVIRRRKITDRKTQPVRELCEEEVCTLDGECDSMTTLARDTLRLAWAEYSAGIR